jgi:adenylate cyclase
LSAEQRNRKLAAVLSADAAGYSRLMEKDETGTLDTLKANLHLMGSLVEKHRGRVAAIHGDNLLAEFASVVDAVQCALEIQNDLKARNGDMPEEARMPFRIGINVQSLALIYFQAGDCKEAVATCEKGSSGNRTI